MPGAEGEERAGPVFGPRAPGFALAFVPEARRAISVSAGLGALLCALSVTLATPLWARIALGLAWLAALGVSAASFALERRAGIGPDRSALLRELARKDDILRTIDANVPLIVYRRTGRPPDGWDYQFVAGRTAEILGVPAEEAFGRSGLDARVYYARDQDQVNISYAQAIKNGGGMWSAEFRIVPHGEIKWIRAAVRIEVEGGRERSSIGVLIDVTEEKRARERVQHALDRDVLTSLYSRDYFERAVALALERFAAERRLFAVVVFQLDDFQEISDALGIGVGDKLICLIADAARAAAREEQVVARLDSDKFGVLSEIADVDAATALAERVVKHLGGRYSLGQSEIEITVSAGCALPLGLEPRATDLMHDAGSALERARADGGAVFRLYADAMTVESVRRVTIKEALHEALEHGGFTLAYQPKIDLASGRVAGCEALIRWHHRVLGVQAPAQFIPIAERSGLIVPIGDWVFREACRQYVAWQRAGIAAVPIAVNVSPVQFARSDVHKVLADAMSDTGAPPGSIDVEITESLLVDCSDKLIGELKKIRALGSEISLDDFGAGFSSITYLKRLPLSLLKIDQSFASSAMNSSTDAAIVRSIVYLAEELGLRVVAEGAETAEQVEYLRAAGCQEIQGYFFSKPLSAGDFAEFVTLHGVVNHHKRAVRVRVKRSAKGA